MKRFSNVHLNGDGRWSFFSATTASWHRLELKRPPDCRYKPYQLDGEAQAAGRPGRGCERTRVGITLEKQYKTTRSEKMQAALHAVRESGFKTAAKCLVQMGADEGIGAIFCSGIGTSSE